MIPKILRNYALKHKLTIRREKFADGTVYSYLVDGKLVHHSATPTGMLAWLKRHAPKSALIERAAAALDMTHHVGDRGPKTLQARNRVALALDTGGNIALKDIAWLESVAEKTKRNPEWRQSGGVHIDIGTDNKGKTRVNPKRNPRGATMSLIRSRGAATKKKPRRKNPTVKGAFWLYLRTARNAWLKLGERPTLRLAKRAAEQIAATTGKQVKILLGRK